MNFLQTKKEFEYMLAFTKVYQNEPDKYMREAKILKMQTYHILQDMEKDELIVGNTKHGLLGFSPQFGGIYTYYFHAETCQKLLNEYKDQLDNVSEIEEMLKYWETENTLYKFKKKFRDNHSELEVYKTVIDKIGKTELYTLGTGVAPLGRLALTVPDIGKLITLGVSGLKDEIRKNCSEDNNFLKASLIAVDTISDAAEFYLVQARQFLTLDPENQNLINLVNALSNIKDNKPSSFYEALLLQWLYTALSDLMNYGRMDVWLGDWYAHDIDNGIIDEEQAITYLTDLYRHYIVLNKKHDTRIILGGKGRPNEENADRLALVFMETSRRVKDIVPQLTLRYYKGMNEEVFDKAIQVNAEGCSYPLLYSDDTNIPAIMKSFNVSYEEALTCIPAGCGEYVFEHKSTGTPNSCISMIKGLELALHNGKDPFFDIVAGPDTGNLEDFDTFEKLWEAYCAQINFELEICAWGEKECYDTMAENAGFLHLSVLMDDCIKSKKPLLEGGVRYLNGSTEIAGIMTAADSFSAIKKVVYEDKTMTLSELVHILDCNFEGYEKERKLLLNCPKYGNDNDEADEMAKKVFNLIALNSKAIGKVVGLDNYHMCSVNNSASSDWGSFTVASACGRKSGDAINNANAPSIGADKNGITSLLNSMSKFDHSIHAGIINNVRFTKELFKNNYEKMKFLLRTYFETNGSQLNLMVIGKDDLENAMAKPEEYQNLIVRIGGFSARFVELDKALQKEILERTTYEAS